MDIFAGCCLNLSHEAQNGKMCVVQGEDFEIIAAVTMPAGGLSRTNDLERFVASGRLAAEIELRPPPPGPQSPVAALGRVMIREPVGRPPLWRGAAVTYLDCSANDTDGGGENGKINVTDTEVQRPSRTVRLRLSSVVEDAMGLLGTDLRCAVTITIRPLERTVSVPLSSKVPTHAAAAATASLASRADTIGLRGIFASPTLRSLETLAYTSDSTSESVNKGFQTPVAAVVPPSSGGGNSSTSGQGTVDGKCNNSECLRARATFRVVIVEPLHIACMPPVLLPSSSFLSKSQSHEENGEVKIGSGIHHGGHRCVVNVVLKNQHPSRALWLTSLQLSLDRSTLNLFDEVDEVRSNVSEDVNNGSASFSSLKSVGLGGDRNDDDIARRASQKLSKVVADAVSAFPVIDTVHPSAENSSHGTQLDLARAFTSGWVLPAACKSTENDKSTYRKETTGAKTEARDRPGSTLGALKVQPTPEGLPLRLEPGDKHAFVLVVSPSRGLVGASTDKSSMFEHFTNSDANSSNGILPPLILRQLAFAKEAINAATDAENYDHSGSHLGRRMSACHDVGLNFQSPITAKYSLDVSTDCSKATCNSLNLESACTLVPAEPLKKQAESSLLWKLPWLGVTSSDALLNSLSRVDRARDELCVEMMLSPSTTTSNSANSVGRGAVVQVGSPFVAEVRVTNLGTSTRHITLYCDNTERPVPLPKQKVPITTVTAGEVPNEEGLRFGESKSQMPPLLSLGNASNVHVVAIDAATPLGDLMPGASIAAPMRFVALAPGPATLGPLRLCAAAPDAPSCGVVDIGSCCCSYRAINFEVLVRR